MTMNISSSNFSSVIQCPTSKSYANRALILAALCKQEVRLLDIPASQDVIDMITVLKKLGLEIEKQNNDLIIKNSFPACEKKSSSITELYLGEGGTTVRFLLPLISLGKNKYNISLHERIVKRPMQPLYDLLTNLDVTIDNLNSTSFYLQGPLNTNSVIEVDCTQTTQFASGFLLLQLNQELQVELKNLNASKGYIEITKLVVSKFQERLTEKCIDYRIPADFSSFGYIVAASLFQKINIPNVFEVDTWQGDSKAIAIYKELGGKIEFSDSGASLTPPSVLSKGFKVDGSECIDLVPTLMFMASFLPEESVIENVQLLVHKECDRLKEMMKMLKFFGISFTYDRENDKFVIHPGNYKEIVKVRDYSTQPDHRMIMVASLFLKKLGGGNISPSENVSKSFPRFFEYFS